MSASNTVVQETPKLTITFTSSTVVPGTNTNADFKQAIMIRWPDTFTFRQDTPSAYELKVGGVVQTITVSREMTNTYHSDCGIYVCNLIEFTRATDIPANTVFEFATEGLKNPISVKKVNDIKLSTQMKYTTDGRYYDID